MPQNAEQVLTNVIVTDPKEVLTIYTNKEGGIGVSWSDMDLERLCYLKDVVNMAVNGRINQAFNPPKSSGKKPKLDQAKQA